MLYFRTGISSNGIAAFILKYRLIPTGDNFMAEVQERIADRAKMAGPLSALRR